MEVVLYPGCSGEQLDLLCQNLDEKELHNFVDSDYFGYKIIVCMDETMLEILKGEICSYIVETYLKDAILTKIYDEYPLIDVYDSGLILVKLVEEIKKHLYFNNIDDILKSNKKFNIESYVLFNIKRIMLIAYSLVDKLCGEVIHERQRKAFLSLIRTYATLSGQECDRADAELCKELSTDIADIISEISTLSGQNDN